MKARKIFKVEVTNGAGALYTLYCGPSRQQAEKSFYNARATMIISNGSGELTLRENNIADVVYAVKDGEAVLTVIGGCAQRIDLKRNAETGSDRT